MNTKTMILTIIITTLIATVFINITGDNQEKVLIGITAFSINFLILVIRRVSFEAY